MALPAHMTLQGEKQGNIDGSCTMKGREKTILVQSFSHGLSMPYDYNTGRSSGKRSHQPVTISKEIDKSSPKLYQALCTGEHMKNVTIKHYRIDSKGQEEHYFTHVLEDAVIVNLNMSLEGESVSFSYMKIKWRWEPDGIESEDSWDQPVSK